MNIFDIVMMVIFVLGLIICKAVNKPDADKTFGNMCIWVIVYIGFRLLGVL